MLNANNQHQNPDTVTHARQISTGFFVQLLDFISRNLERTVFNFNRFDLPLFQYSTGFLSYSNVVNSSFGLHII